ncbi:hypothetical protein S40288_07058 [Stachybotrys chartarum IBT 40288]|nr:hypothetical protein S40288_07058 [Stachybotrys chartarum IBT 40288]
MIHTLAIQNPPMMAMPSAARPPFRFPNQTIHNLAKINRLAWSNVKINGSGDDASSDVSATSLDGVANTEDRPGLPPIETVSHGTHVFECPLRHELRVISHDHSGKRHAYRGIRAYVCTLSQDKWNSEMFADSEAWLENELQCHRHQFVYILSPDGPFQTEDDLSSHLKQHHSELVLRILQTCVLMDVSRRTVVDVAAKDCPFCDEWAVTVTEGLPAFHDDPESIALVGAARFFGHVTSHMEKLAMFSIPRGCWEKEGESPDGLQPQA